jgi:hypothetical protein
VIFNLYLVYKLYQVKKILSNTADILVDLEQNLLLIFKRSSLLSLETALKVTNINNKYKLLKKRNQQLKQISLILRLGYQIFGQKFTKFNRKRCYQNFKAI